MYPKCFFYFFFEFFFEVEIWRQSRNFRILRQIFKYFFRRISGNLKVLDRDSGLYSPTVKRESKNSSIQPQNDWSKIATFFGHFPLLKTRRTCRRSFAAIWAARTLTKVPFSTAWRVVLGTSFVFCVSDVWRGETGFERCSDFLPFLVSLKEFEFSKPRGGGSAR